MISDFDAFSARGTLADLQDRSDECGWVRANMLNEDDIIRMRDLTVQRFGRIDVLINNVGYCPDAEQIEDLTAEHWDGNFAINVRQQFLCAKYVIPVMIEGGGGAIVNTGSIFSLVGGIDTFTYCAAKADLPLPFRQYTYRRSYSKWQAMPERGARREHAFV